MMDEPNEENTMEYLESVIQDSGFMIVPVDAILDLLAKMEAKVSEETGVPIEELDGYIERIEDLVGPEETMHMSLDEIIAWVRVLKSEEKS
jgi:hypothetical protein